MPSLLAELLDRGAMPVSLTSNEPEMRARVFERLSRTLYQDQVRREASKDLPPLRKATLAAFPRTGLERKRFGLPGKSFFEGHSPRHPPGIGASHGNHQETWSHRRRGGNPTSGTGYAHRGFNIVLAEVIYLMEDYLKAFDSQATVETYLDRMGPDVKAVLGGQKGGENPQPVPGYLQNF